MPTVRCQERNDRVAYDALTTAELLGSEQDDALTDRSAGTESEDQRLISEDDEQSLLSQLSALQAADRSRSVRFEDEESNGSQEPQRYPRTARIASSSSSPRSPLLKKFAPVQERRVNTVLLEALHLTDISRDEIGLIERSIKRLNDAIVGFALLVDKQVKIIVGLQDKEFLEMRDLRTFLHGILAFFIARNPALRLMDKAYHRRLMPDYVNELADALVMDMQLIPQLSGRSVIVTPVNTLEEYVCTEPYRFDRLLHGVHVDLSDSSTKNSSPNGSPGAPAVAVANTCPTSPFKERNGGTMNGGKVAEMAMIKPREPELIETAEQTLGMAKLLHELATAECEARNGNRISVRAQVPHAKEFSKAYIASSKELMLQETSFL
ncbi:hypothetical protein JG687_00006046 [Phytophthora cactorum]|uniref:Uncharacterized protein n=1 Tax=Phytophthora cactorum TaxID=29920 RepID=A0A8T1UKM5_9STRA|nr:hypothetical protein JG687_00006046 [Phytophthora cactorum]